MPLRRAMFLFKITCIRTDRHRQTRLLHTDKGSSYDDDSASLTDGGIRIPGALDRHNDKPRPGRAFGMERIAECLEQDVPSALQDIESRYHYFCWPFCPSPVFHLSQQPLKHQHRQLQQQQQKEEEQNSKRHQHQPRQQQNVDCSR